MTTSLTQEGSVFTPPPPVPPAKNGRTKMALIGAGMVLVAAAAFAAGRLTAPEKGRSVAATGTGTTVLVTAPANDPTATTVADPNAAVLAQALSLHQAGKVDEAAVLYNQILASDPKNKYALFNLGQIAHSKNDLDTAIQKYDAALKVDPDFSSALYNDGLAHASKGDRAKAVELLTHLVQLEPKNAPALYNLGTVLVADGKTDQGTKYLNDAYAIDPTLKPAG